MQDQPVRFEDSCPPDARTTVNAHILGAAGNVLQAPVRSLPAQPAAARGVMAELPGPLQCHPQGKRQHAGLIRIQQLSVLSGHLA